MIDANFAEDIKNHDEQFEQDMKKALVPVVKNLTSIANKATEDSVTYDYVPGAVKALASFVGNTPESLGRAVFTITRLGNQPEGIDAKASDPAEIIDEPDSNSTQPDNGELRRLEELVADYQESFKQIAGALEVRMSGGRPDLTDLTSKMLGEIEKRENAVTTAKTNAEADVNAANANSSRIQADATRVQNEFDEYAITVAKAVKDLEHLPEGEKEEYKRKVIRPGFEKHAN